MSPSSQQLEALARGIVESLERASLIELAAGREAAITSIVQRFAAYFQATARLEREAEDLADEHLKKAPARGAGLDRRRVVQMIKDRLARERDLPV